MFNPVVSHFRIHFFSVRPCFNFSTGTSLSDFANSFFLPDKYYKSDPGPHQQPTQVKFSLRRLGRRCQYDRQDDLSGTVLHAHKFWSAYMSKVADSDYRGPWCGLAPLRAEFQDKEQRLLHIKKDALPLGQTAGVPLSLELRAFPKLHLCPIGWAVGIVVDVKGDLQFETLPLLVNLLRTTPAFIYRNQKDPLQIDQVLTGMHRMVRDTLLVTDRRHPTVEMARTYIVCSPVRFQDQAGFAGDEEVDLSLVLRILEQDPALADDSKRLVSPGPRSLTVTRFNRGTMRITSSLNPEEHQSPECALSNLKNCLLMTALMEQFHSDAAGHASAMVGKMREDVELTFTQLKSAWKSPHFHAICNHDSGLQRMMKSAATNVYNFIQSKFEGVAIGDNAKVLRDLDPARRAIYLANQRNWTQGSQTTENLSAVTAATNGEKNMASKYNITQNTMTNTAIGDNATQIVQGWGSNELQKFAEELLNIRPKIGEKAATQEQKDDVETIDAIQKEAAKGNKSTVIENLKKLGKWGWDTLKELGVSVAAEALKKAVGF